MKKIFRTDSLEDFIENPSPLSRHLVELAVSKKQKYDRLFGSKNFFTKVKLRIQYQNQYLEICKFIRSYRQKSRPCDGTIQRIDSLFDELARFFDLIALNNLCLTYAFLVEKDKSNPILTKEEEKLLSLKKLYAGEISREEFNTAFGHYALNPYELSAKRFCEYSKEEILGLAKFLDDFSIRKTITLDAFLQAQKKNRFPIYSSLREELKYLSLWIVRDLRFNFLKFASENSISNIFDMDYDDIQRNSYRR